MPIDLRPHLANLITTSRGLAGIGVVLLLCFDHNLLAFYLFIAAICTDLIDGILARRYGAASTFGLWLDAASDKCLAGMTWIGLGWIGWAPAWIVVTILMRNILVAIGWWIARARGVTFEPNLLGRLMISFEGVTLPFLLLHYRWAGVHWASAGVILAIITLTLAVGSATQYAFQRFLENRSV